MGQEQSSGVNTLQQSQKGCRPCGDWGNKEYNTVKVDSSSLWPVTDKENGSHPNGQVHEKGKAEKPSEEELEKQKAFQEEARRAEEARREMERRVREEQERQQGELRRREAERRQLQIEQAAKEREEQLQKVQEMRRQAELERQHQEQERLEQIRLQEEARQGKIKEMDDKKKVRAYLHTNGFKGVNDLVRKKFTKTTPLHTAVGQNDAEMIKLLLAAGADAQKFNGKNETAMKLALKLNNNNNHAAVVQVLTTHEK